MIRLKFFWQGSGEQVAYLKRLARATGHASIRDLFGTCVSAGLATIERTLREQREAMEAEAIKSEAGAADESNMQCETAGDNADASNVPVTP